MIYGEWVEFLVEDREGTGWLWCFAGCEEFLLLTAGWLGLREFFMKLGKGLSWGMANGGVSSNCDALGLLGLSSGFSQWEGLPLVEVLI